jgi:hypothetical protein
VTIKRSDLRPFWRRKGAFLIIRPVSIAMLLFIPLMWLIVLIHAAIMAVIESHSEAVLVCREIWDVARHGVQDDLADDVKGGGA